jgi:aldose 1-epimerase
VSKLVTLRRGDLSLTLFPAAGGSIASFRLATATGEVDLMRPSSERALADQNSLDSACYPLVPFSNRIENGKLRFNGREYRLTPNFPDHPHPLHGHGCWQEWALSAEHEISATLTFAHQGPDYPSAYQAEQRFVLLDDGLECRLSMRNTGSEAMPAGVGFHPFFPKTACTKVKVPLGGVWLSRDGIPYGHGALPAEWDFGELRELGSVVLDHCFSGWNRTARIEWPKRGLAIQMTGSDAFGHVVIYTPAGQDFFCVEPVSNANDAFNMAARGVPNTGTVVLAPGESLGATMRLVVERQ